MLALLTLVLCSLCRCVICGVLGKVGGKRSVQLTSLAESVQYASKLFPLTHQKKILVTAFAAITEKCTAAHIFSKCVTFSVSAVQVRPDCSRQIYNIFMRQWLRLKYLKWSLCQHNCFRFINILDCSIVAVDNFYAGERKNTQFIFNK